MSCRFTLVRSNVLNMAALYRIILLSLLLIQEQVWGCLSWNWSYDKVRLEDIQVLTLKSGHMTTGRRSSPVPQLQCVGGTANCEFMPKVVQCYNRGSDGTDIQWECKADMDNEYRFGEISVNCEGYKYPEDPYVLKGSCGLEYTIDFTKAGGFHILYYRDGSAYRWGPPNLEFKDFVKGLCGAIVIIGIVYTICKLCSGAGKGTSRRSAPPPPPPAGFRPQFYPGPGYGYNNANAAGSNNNNGSFSGGGGGSGTGGGFWNGAATGGILGYALGSLNNNGGGGTHRTVTYSTPVTPATNVSLGSGSSSRSTGTRTVSGFGGTTRR